MISLSISGTVELLVEDIVYSGNMLHWSANNNDLSIADIWGQLYLRFTPCSIILILKIDLLKI